LLISDISKLLYIYKSLEVNIYFLNFKRSFFIVNLIHKLTDMVKSEIIPSVIYL
jgi:hypothetical protein